MPLYVAEVEVSVVIEADDEKSAERNARRYLEDEVRMNGISWPSVGLMGKYVPDGWDDSVPYGSEGSETVRQILIRAEEAKKRAPPTAAELEAAGQQRLIAE